MSVEQKNFQRNDTGDDHKGRRHDRENLVNQELKTLIRKGLSDPQVMQQLKTRFGDKDLDLINEVFKAYADKKKFLQKRARKFQNIIMRRYPDLSHQDRIRKAKKFAKKSGLTDDEFNLFLNFAFTDSGTVLSRETIPVTPMSQLLGTTTQMQLSQDKLNIKESELEVVYEIIKLHGQTKSLHSQVVLQSLTYRDCAPEALNGTAAWQAYKKNVYSFVHPVVAALFLPKVKLLDEHMLIANFGNIVKNKHEGVSMMTQPDYELYWSLVNDPTENMICNSDSAIKDLYQRFFLQTKLWDSVLNLRQGMYYEERLNDFIVAIDMCRNNIYDAPDLTYVKDEGTILRRLLSAFSIRPTLVSTTRLYGNGMTDVESYSYGLNQNPLMASGITQVTTVPMITLRLPVNYGIKQNMYATCLEDALVQPQWFVDSHTITPKFQTVLHSRDVIFFYVNRRYQTVNLTRMNVPCNFNTLPMTVAGWEALNERVVNFDNRMTIFNDQYILRSVVIIERSQSKKNLIVGSTAGIVVPRNLDLGRFDETYLLYDPQGSSEMFLTSDNEYHRNPPITTIPGQTPFNAGSTAESFYERASKRGTIFMYQKDTAYTCKEDENFIRFG